jgi:peptide/nickel transport system permease protein
VHRLLGRRFAALVVTTAIALSLGHVIFNAGLDQMGWGAAIKDVPNYLGNLAQGDLGETPGGGCNPKERVALCASYGGGQITDVLHERLPVDVQLVVGGLLLGTFLGVLAGRWCAAFPRTATTRVVHVLIAVLQSCPPYFLAFVFLMWFSWNSGDYKLPFVSGQGDYVPFSDQPLQFIKAMWVPWVCAGLSLAALWLESPRRASMRRCRRTSSARPAPRACPLNVSSTATHFPSLRPQSPR